MKYETDRKKLVEAAKGLAYCIENEADEDAHRWALEILNGLYGISVSEHARLGNILDQAKRKQ